LTRAVRVEHRQHEEVRVGSSLEDLPRGVDAAQLGHLKIHEDGVGLQLDRKPHGLDATGGFGDDADAAAYPWSGTPIAVYIA
jgi:hypothetical protein